MQEERDTSASAARHAVETGELLTNIGLRVRKLRETQGLSLREVARRAGLSGSAVQKTEAGSMAPTIGVLMKIARGLRCKVTDFLEEDERRGQVVLTRKPERRRVAWGGGSIKVETLAGDTAVPELLMFDLHLQRGADSGKDLLSHRGEEIVLCLKGEIRFSVEEETMRLRSGDSLHFKSHLPHRWSNPGPAPARMLLICTAAGGERTLPWQ